MDLPTGTVTFLFTDIEGSTRLWERQPEAMRGALARHDQILRTAAERHGGYVFKTVGDAFCVAFEDAARAVAAALDAQLALAGEEWGEPGPLRCRMALHAGRAEEREGDYFGPTLNRAARLLAIGHGGQTLLSQTATELVGGALPPNASLRDLGAHRLKDLELPEHVCEVVGAGLPDEFPPLRSLASLPHNLPLQPTSFIGRERELTHLRGLVPASRLLTLTGPGGSGKTRLGLQLVAELAESYPDGAWLIDLAPLSDASLVPQTVASALGVREMPGRDLTETLTDWLKPRRLLLLLDNCEHVLDACAQLVATLMRNCPEVRLLATSRERLGISGEVVRSVPGLSAPELRLDGAAAHVAASFIQYEAVRLFVDRALTVPGFALTDQSALAVAHICHRLDGMPLAIELAAGRVKTLSPDQIAARLDERFRLLTGGSRAALPRHQTLRATIDWSYELLSEPERAVLRRLSVFAGGWTLEAAEAICPDAELEEMEVLELQAHLIDKSLAIAEPDAGGDTRYRLLATIRQYARERLGQSGEAARVHRRHRDWFLELAERAATEFRWDKREQAQWLERLEREYDNLRAALEWSQSDADGAEPGLRLAGALQGFWHRRGYFTEGRQWLEAALSTGAGASAAARAKALRGAGTMTAELGDWQQARTLTEQSLFLYRELADRRGQASALSGLGHVDLVQGDHDLAVSYLEEALALAREIQATDLASGALNNLGEVARGRGDYALARKLYEEALEEAGQGDRNPVPLFNLGQVALSQGDCTAAHDYFVRTLKLSAKLGYRTFIAHALEGVAEVIALQGEPGRALRLLAAANTIRQAINTPIEPADLPEYERALAAARAALGEASFAAAWVEGQAMTTEQAIKLGIEPVMGSTTDGPIVPATP